MPTDIKPLFSSIDIRGRAARNRLAVAPMTRVTATEDGRATETMGRYYERFSRGGFGVVFSEGIYTDQKFAQGYRHQPGISDDAQARAWQPVVEGIKRHGALAIAQMMHAGALSQGNRFSKQSAAPSAVQPKGRQLDFYYGKDEFAVPAMMNDEQIADAIMGIAQSAARAVEVAGFDGIEIHGANGYLLDQFLTDYTNQRDDHWGGPTSARIGLIRATYQATRERLGSSVPLGVRISQGKVNDPTHKWLGGEADAEIVFGTLSDAGADFIHVTEYEAWKPAFDAGGPSLVRLARKYAPKAIIVANGNLHLPERAVAALGDGADIVSVARGALANPDLPRRIAETVALDEFDGGRILQPIASIKDHELVM